MGFLEEVNKVRAQNLQTKTPEQLRAIAGQQQKNSAVYWQNRQQGIRSSDPRSQKILQERAERQRLERLTAEFNQNRTTAWDSMARARINPATKQKAANYQAGKKQARADFAALAFANPKASDQELYTALAAKVDPAKEKQYTKGYAKYAQNGLGIQERQFQGQTTKADTYNLQNAVKQMPVDGWVKSFLTGSDGELVAKVAANPQLAQGLPQNVKDLFSQMNVSQQSHYGANSKTMARIQSAGGGFLESATLGASSQTMSNAEKDYYNEVAGAHPVANFAGSMAGYALPGEAFDRGTMALGKALGKQFGKQGAKAGAAELTQGGAKALGKEFLRKGNVYGVSNAGLGLVEGAVRGEDKQQQVKDALLNYGGGFLLGGGVAAAGKLKTEQFELHRRLEALGRKKKEERQQLFEELGKVGMEEPALTNQAKPVAVANKLAAEQGKGMAKADSKEIAGQVHTPAMQRIMKEYEQAVDPGIVDYVKKVKSGAVGDKDLYYLATVTPKAAKEVSDLVGFDVSGYQVAMNPATVRHISKRHGSNGIQDQSMSSVNDLARIQYILENYDNVVKNEGKSLAFYNKNGKRSDTVVYTKRVDGTYYVVQAVPDTKAKTMQVVTAYKTKAKEKEAGVRPLHAISLSETSENATALPTSLSSTTIQQNANGVNPSIRQSVEEDAALEQQTFKTRKNIYQGVKKSGEAANVSKSTQAQVWKMADALRVPVEFVDGLEKGAAGKYQKGKIYLSRDAEHPVIEVFKHELTHRLEDSDLYHTFQKTILESKPFANYLQESGLNDLDGLRLLQREYYTQRGVNLSTADVDKEIVADFVGSRMFERLFTDEAAVVALHRQDRNLFQKIADFVHEVWLKLKGSSDAKFFEDAEFLYRRALEQANERGAKLGASEGRQFSIIKENGKNLVRIDTDQELFDGIPIEEYSKIARKVMNKRFRGKVLEVSDHDLARVKDSSAGEYSYPRKFLYGQEYEAKMKSSTELDNLLKASTYFRSAKDDGRHAVAAHGWDYYKTEFELEGKRFEGIINIARSEKGSMFYDITDIKRLPDISSKQDAHLAPSTSTFRESPKGSASYGMAQINEAAIIGAEPLSASTLPQGQAEVNGSISTSAAKSAPKGQKSFGGPNAMLKQYVDQYGSVDNALQALGEKYGTIQPGMQPRNESRVGKVPKQVEQGKKVQQFARTAYESKFTDEEMAGELERQIVSGEFSYEPFTDKKATQQAQRKLENLGYRDALERWNNIYNGNGLPTKADMATAELLINEAIKAEDYRTASELIQQVAITGTELGQAVQAMSMLKKLSPAGRYSYIEKSLKKINEGIAKKTKDKAKRIAIPEKLRDDLLGAKGPEQITAAEEAITKYIGEQVPTTLLDKINAYRYLSMLGNPKTHLRNIVGNGMMFLVRRTKNTLGAVMESAVAPIAKATGHEMERTKTLRLGSKETRRFAKEDFSSVVDQITAGGKGGFESDIREYQKVYKSKAFAWLEWLRKKNGNALEKEDVFFMRRAYESSLSNYITANGLDSAYLKSGTKEANQALNQARNYAVLEAQKATFREANALATCLNRLEKSGKAGQLIVGGTVPFKKTPMNILKRGVEYSPLGIIKGTADLARLLKGGEKTAAQAIDSLAAGLTGTGVMALGYWLAHNGILQAGGADNDKEKYYEQMQGQQPYSLQIGDTTYTLDWLTPTSMPLFMGVELYESKNGGQDENLAGLNRMLDAMTKVSDPMMQLSMLQGVNDAMSGFHDKGLLGGIGGFASSSLQSYGGQFIPTLSGQIARTIDPVRRTTYASKDSPFTKSVEQFGRKMMNKLPGLSMKNEPYIDQWGRQDINENGIGWRVLENFASPGYLGKIKTTYADREINRLYEKYGESGILPGSMSSSITESNQKYNLTPKEYTGYKQSAGRNAATSINQLIASRSYKKAEDVDKQQMIMDCYTYAKAAAKQETLGKRGKDVDLDRWVQAACEAGKDGYSAAEVILARYAQQDIEGDKDAKGKTIYLSASRKKKAAVDRATPYLSAWQRQRLYALFKISPKVW